VHTELGRSQVEVQRCTLSWEVGKELGEELARRKLRWKLMQTWSRRNWRRRQRRAEEEEKAEDEDEEEEEEPSPLWTKQRNSRCWCNVFQHRINIIVELFVWGLSWRISSTSSLNKVSQSLSYIPELGTHFWALFNTCHWSCSLTTDWLFRSCFFLEWFLNRLIEFNWNQITKQTRTTHDKRCWCAVAIRGFLAKAAWWRWVPRKVIS